eukprot:12931479-Alexandrium_andersonii.AAC.1
MATTRSAPSNRTAPKGIPLGPQLGDGPDWTPPSVQDIRLTNYLHAPEKTRLLDIARNGHK